MGLKGTIENQFFLWLSSKVSTIQLSESYLAYSDIEDFCLKTNVLKKPLFQTTDLQIITKIKYTVESNKVFRYTHKDKLSVITSLINFYYIFIKENQVLFEDKKYISTSEKASVAKPDQNTVDLKPYEFILAEKFQKGFRLDSKLELKRFKRFYLERYGKDIEVDDDMIQKHIRSVGIQHDSLLYLPEAMLGTDKKQKLLNYIVKNFSDGKRAIYYEALFREFSIEFQGERIYNADMLKTYLSYINNGLYYMYRSYIAKDSYVEVNPMDEIREYLVEYGAPVNLNDLYRALPHIPSNKIKQILNFNKEFIYNAPEQYFHVDAVELSEEELEYIAAIIQHAIDDKEFMGGNELIEDISQRYPEVLEHLSQFSPIGLRDAIGYKLSGTYFFNGNIISKCDKSLSMYDVYADYSKTRKHFTLDELNNLKRELNTNIYFGAVYANSLRINQDEFVSKEQAQFDVEKTDEAIDRFCVGAYIALSEINQFGSFPDAGFPWNSYLLEHYVSDYSASYKLLHTSFNANACVGAIVKRESEIESFNDLITDVLVNSNVSLNKEGALQYLCDKGFLARRRYAEIDQILIKAKAKRTQKG